MAKRTEHALADAGQLRTLLAGVGFRDIVIRTASKLVRFPSPADYVRIQLAATPLASLIAQDDAAGRERLVAALVEDVGAALLPYVGEEDVTFPQEVHSVLATS